MEESSSQDVATLYLDDFAPGQRYVTGSHEITAAEIKAYAAEFDPQPFHLDEAAARETLFGGLCASGWHTGAITMRLLVAGELAVAGGLVGLGADITWPTAVRPGDVLHVEIEVLEVTPSRSKPDRGVVRTRNVTVNQKGEAVQIAHVRLLVPRRGVGADAAS